jgi:hypothetical protein
MRYIDRKSMDAAKVRRWIAGFEAAAEAERWALRREGARPAWSVTVALSMIQAAEEAGRLPAEPDAVRALQELGVRETWRRLRERMAR